MAMTKHSSSEEDRKVNVLLPALSNGREATKRTDLSVEEGMEPEIQDMPELAEATIKDFVSVFKLLSDETRLRILFYLTQRDELHVRALCSPLVRVAGLIAPRRSGKHNFYHLLPHRFQELLDTLFASIPEQDRRLRFENYVLSYSPVVDVM
jgi:ArsR family transcriptional regulator, arsenate/arsenite/antimonite-responsive transcriptional repressor